MNKLTTVFLCVLVQGAFGAESYDVKSFRTVNKLCGKCHGTPFYMAKQKGDDTWEDFFENEQTLLDLHKEQPKAVANLQSKRFKYYREDILKFFIDNSKYSGVVHGCDANFCGTHH